MLYDIENNREDDIKKFRQRMADQNIQSIVDRQDEIQHAKNGFIGMLAGILVGGVVGCMFLGPSYNMNQEKEIPVIRKPITPAKVQPNDPGGMEIDNQDREIYHIVDNIPQEKKEVNIIPTPEMPKIIIENNIPASENIENLVESIEEDSRLNDIAAEITNTEIENIKIANSELAAIKTNSQDKIVIPKKIKDIEVKLQKNITPQAIQVEKKQEKQNIVEEKIPLISEPAAKGTWYAQIIASSSIKAVENLWIQLSSKHNFLKTYSHEIEEITAANGNKLYRLKIGAFKTRKEAEALSDKLKQNQISCIIKQN